MHLKVEGVQTAEQMSEDTPPLCCNSLAVDTLERASRGTWSRRWSRRRPRGWPTSTLQIVGHRIHQLEGEATISIFRQSIHGRVKSKNPYQTIVHCILHNTFNRFKAIVCDPSACLCVSIIAIRRTVHDVTLSLVIKCGVASRGENFRVHHHPTLRACIPWFDPTLR